MNTHLTLARIIRLIASGSAFRDHAPTNTARTGLMLAGPSGYAIETLLHLIDQYARRTLNLAPVSAPALAPDERAIIGLLAAAQTGHTAEIEARASWIVRRGGQKMLIAAAEDLAATLAIEGHFLEPVSMTQPPQQPYPLAALPEPVGAAKRAAAQR